MVITLSPSGTLDVALLTVVGIEYPIPGAVLMIDKVRPAVLPQLIVTTPVFFVTGGLRQQGGRGETFRLDPKILIVITDCAVKVEAIKEATVLLVPGYCPSPIEQLLCARQQPSFGPVFGPARARPLINAVLVCADLCPTITVLVMRRGRQWE